MAEFPGSEIEVSSHLINYENRPGIKNRMANGIKISVCKNDSGADVTESFYPAFNDMARLNASGADSDIPPLMGHMEILTERRDKDSDFSDLTKPADLRELVETHSILAGNDSQLQNLANWQESNKHHTTSPNHTSEIQWGAVGEDQFRTWSGWGGLVVRGGLLPDGHPMGGIRAEGGDSSGTPVAPKGKMTTGCVGDTADEDDEPGNTQEEGREEEGGFYWKSSESRE